MSRTLDLLTVSRRNAIAASAALVALVCLPGVGLAGPPAPAMARQPDLTVRAVASHWPGAAAAGRPARPLRRSSASPPALTPMSPSPRISSATTSTSAGVNRQGLVASGNTPSDSTGAIGPVHYIEMVNVQVGLFDRS